MPDPEIHPAAPEPGSGQLPGPRAHGGGASGGRSPGDHRGLAFSAEQRAGLRQRQVVQDRTLQAMHQLESALGSAAPRREGPWRHEVLEALAVLESATTAEAENAERPDSLLADIARTQPRLRNRARAVRLAYRQLREAIVAIRRELGGSGSDVEDDLDGPGAPGTVGTPGADEVVGASKLPGFPEGRHASDGHGIADGIDVADVRHRLAWILSGLRQQRARESDLIYEAYFDAFRADLAAEREAEPRTDGSRSEEPPSEEPCSELPRSEGPRSEE